MAKTLGKLLVGQRAPKLLGVVARIEQWSKALVAIHRRVNVIGAAALALVAPEEPAVSVEPLGGAFFDGSVGNAEPCIDAAFGSDCAGWAS